MVGYCVSADKAVEVLFELDDGIGGGLGGGSDAAEAAEVVDFEDVELEDAANDD